MSERKEKFEKMLRAVQEEYRETCSKMEMLKTQGKTKTATYRQLTGRKRPGNFLSNTSDTARRCLHMAAHHP